MSLLKMAEASTLCLGVAYAGLDQGHSNQQGLCNLFSELVRVAVPDAVDVAVAIKIAYILDYSR